jgi:hypothetical protein
VVYPHGQLGQLPAGQFPPQTFAYPVASRMRVMSRAAPLIVFL